MLLPQPKNTTKWLRRREFFIALVGMLFCSVASSFTLIRRQHQVSIQPDHPQSRRRQQQKRRNGSSFSLPSSSYAYRTKLHQSTTTSPQADIVTLNWMEFHNPEQMEPSHTPVLLLHGLLGRKSNLATLASSLGAQLDRPRRIVGVDLRNHGDSAWSEEMSYMAMATDVVEFLNSQNIPKVVLVGHSMGGKVAQTISLTHPDRVEGLVVLDIAPVQYSRSDENWKAVEDILHAIHGTVEVAASSGGGKAVVDKLLRHSIPDPNLRAFVLTNYDNRKKEWKIPIGTIVDQLEQLAGFDVPEEASYEGDVFIIHGGQSRFVRSAYLDQIAGYFPNHMLTTIRGAGHWVHAEAPDDTIALLKRYLDR